MKKTICIITLLTLGISLWADDTVIKKSKGAVSFVVDEDLPKPKEELRCLADSIVAKVIMQSENMPDDDGTRILSYSFKGSSLVMHGPAVLFDMLRTAYADHRPVVLSPDALWLIISQGFSRYVNAHAEEMRPLLVNHQEGRQNLSIVSQKDLLTEDADWAALLDGFTRQLGKNTKGDLAKNTTADFSTTGATERIASQVVLMDVFKQYFNYQVMYIVCGIPYITLTGTP